MSSERERFLQTLEAAHEFPGPYTFKIIGDNGPTLMDSAMAVVRSSLPRATPEVSVRESGKGNHQSITVIVEVPNAEVVHDIYASLKTLPGLRMLL